MTSSFRMRRRLAATVTTALIATIVAGTATASWAEEGATDVPGDSTPVVVEAPAPAAPVEPAPIEPAVEPAPAEPAVEPAPVEPPAQPGPASDPDPVDVPSFAAGPGGEDPQPMPEITISMPGNGRFDWYDEPVTASIVATSGLGIDTLTWSTTGAQTGGATVQGGRTTVEISAEGTTTLTVWAVDRDGNASSDVVRRVKLDLTEPTAALIAPTTRVLRTGEHFRPLIDCADVLSGVDSCSLRIGIHLFSDYRENPFDSWIDEPGIYPLAVEAVDNAGNFTSVPLGQMRVVDADEDAPVVTITEPPLPSTGWFAAPIDVTFSADDGLGSGVDRIEYRTVVGSGSYGPWTSAAGDSVTVHVDQDGMNLFQVRAVDAFGNVSASKNGAYAIDTTAPTVTIYAPGPDGVELDLDQIVELNYICSDPASGIESCTGTIPTGSDLDTSEPGTFEYHVVATDNAGHVTDVLRHYTVIAPDTAGPDIRIEMPAVPASGWFTTEPVITITAEDPSGVAELVWDTTNPYGGGGTVSEPSGTVTFDDFMDGLSSIRVYAVDEEGNRSDTRTLQVRVDTTVPWITIDSPANERPLVAATEEIEQGSRVAFEFHCDDNASGIASCASSTGATLDTTTLGVHRVSVTATDNAGLAFTEELAYLVVPAAADPDPQTGGGAQQSGEPGSALALTGSSDPFGTLWVALGLVLLGVVTTGSVLVARRGR